MTQPLTYEIDRRLPIAVVRLHGALTPLSSPVARDALTEALLAEPTSVVVDMSGVTEVEDVAMTLFPAVAELAGRWPGASLLLGAALPPVAAALERMAIRQPQFPTVAAAIAAAAHDPVPLRVHRYLQPTVDAPRVARELAARVCQEWGLPAAATLAEIVSSELVTNAVRHAGTPIELSVTVRDHHLRVSVRDGTHRLARLLTPTESDDHGRGLLIVDSVATAWGSVPTPGGKTVWAILPIPPRRGPPVSAEADHGKQV